MQMRRSRRIIFNTLAAISGILALCTFVIRHREASPQGPIDRICFTNSRHELYYSDVDEGGIGFSIVYDWPGYQPLRWVSGSDGPYLIQLSGGPLGETASRWRGFPATITYHYVATVANGNGYIDAKDQGILPTRMSRSSPLDWGQPPFALAVPIHYTKLLRVEFVQLCTWNVCNLLYLCFWPLPALWLAIRMRRVIRWYDRRRLERAGRCGICGYDLRASPHRCPECGWPEPHTKSRTGTAS